VPLDACLLMGDPLEKFIFEQQTVLRFDFKVT
jgi:hypothetical protein